MGYFYLIKKVSFPSFFGIPLLPTHLTTQRCTRTPMLHEISLQLVLPMFQTHRSGALAPPPSHAARRGLLRKNRCNQPDNCNRNVDDTPD